MPAYFKIIHIGLHKTGTTYLQNHWFSKLRNILYIHGNHFFRNWDDRAGKQNDNLLISYEGFSGLPWNKEWKKGIPNNHHWLNSFDDNIKLLNSVFSNAIIIVVFRKHGNLLTSLYKQYIQGGGVLKFSLFYGELGVLRPKDLSFRHRINLLKENFDNVYFLNYEKYLQIGDDYMKSFFEKELRIDIIDDDNKRKSKSNYSISGSKIYLLRRINTYYQRLPNRFRTIFRYFQLSPRDFLQNHLRFWRPKDPPYFEEVSKKIDADFADDWAYFESHQWEYKP